MVWVDIQHLYKSELQVYAQKRNLGFPVYSCEREGPPHASRFKCRVTIEGKTYESSEYFHTLKEAEHAAAKVALISLSPDCVQKDDSAFYKNLLHQLVQKEGLQLPAYYPNRSGEAHSPVFVSSVEIEGEHFIGEEAKTKKQAEMNAAKVAYNALKERRSSQIPLVMPSSFQGQEASKFLSSPAQSNTAANLLQHIKPTAPVQQAKDRTGEYGPSSSEILHGSIPNVFPSAPCESRRDSSSSSPSPPNCSTNLAANSSFEPSFTRIDLSSYKRIAIYPANKPIPDGSTSLPMRDDNWVAFAPPEATR
ncbi:double-stranded RNA-binding protein 4 [Morus notabilis]|uniref:double-stranded RNA-binding protein 4 n=1 Tax=Morus notabilis TaxID=981085 RepID=UPI000CED3261|nr:double-stranded RNA-binding protein 4 [Morus notabilis]